MMESEERDGFLTIPLTRIVEVQADRRVVVDDRFIPSCLRVSAAPALSNLLSELVGMLGQRAEALAARLSQPGARGVAEIQDFLLLQAVNRWLPLLAHWSDAGNVHPEDLYAFLVQVSGELATFFAADKRASSYPAYRHEDLQRSYTPVVADLRRFLSAVLEPTAVEIPLQLRSHGVRVGPITDRNLLRTAQFVLTVRADTPAENIRRLFADMPQTFAAFADAARRAQPPLSYGSPGSGTILHLATELIKHEATQRVVCQDGKAQAPAGPCPA
jgi:type VI secretion system protein ImpJ